MPFPGARDLMERVSLSVKAGPLFGCHGSDPEWGSRGDQTETKGTPKGNQRETKGIFSFGDPFGGKPSRPFCSGGWSSTQQGFWISHATTMA